MFSIPTVFVLGAGASFPLGYPVGETLVEQIRTLSVDYFKSELLRAKLSVDLLVRFQEELTTAMPPSIDYFLECRPEFLEVGKLAIAFGIIQHEKPEPLFERARIGSWYRLLIDALGPRAEDIPFNRLKIITFNYDRSLEQTLFATFKSRFNLSDAAAAELVGKIPIVHIYGQVGALPWQNLPGMAKRAYSFVGAESDVVVAATGIQIISEAKDDDSPVLVQARQMVSEAERAVILGFGFFEENCRRIGLDGTGKNFYASRTGITDGRVQVLTHKYHVTFPVLGTIPDFMLNSVDYIRISSGE